MIFGESQDLNSCSNFIVNFFENDEYHENESSLNIYQILVLSLVDDYQNFYNSHLFMNSDNSDYIFLI